MDPTDLQRLAALVAALRKSGRPIPISALEVLLLVASGVDNTVEILQQMTARGATFNKASLSRCLSLLRGRSRYEQGRWVESPFNPLVLVDRHPHQRGNRLQLSEAGRSLLTDSLQYKGTTLLGSSRCSGEAITP